MQYQHIEPMFEFIITLLGWHVWHHKNDQQPKDQKNNQIFKTLGSRKSVLVVKFEMQYQHIEPMFEFITTLYLHHRIIFLSIPRWPIDVVKHGPSCLPRDTSLIP